MSVAQQEHKYKIKAREKLRIIRVPPVYKFTSSYLKCAKASRDYENDPLNSVMSQLAATRGRPKHFTR